MTTKEAIVDCFLTVFIFSPLVICYWAGTWQLLDMYLLPGNIRHSAYVCVGLSFVLMFSAYALEDVLNEYIVREKTVLYLIVSRLYTYIAAFAVVANWRGLWYVLDEYTGVTLLPAGLSFGVGGTILVLLRAFRNVLGPPLPLALDLDNDQHFTVLTRFRTPKGSIWYLLDVFFSVCVVFTLVLVVWRGLWNLQGLLIYPDNQLWRSITNAAIGQVLMIIVFLVQFPARKTAARLHGSSPWLQVFLEDVFVLVVFYATVSYWQGMWSLLNIMLVDNDQRVMMWTVHTLGSAGLLSLRLSTSLQFAGVFIDGEFPDGLGLVMSVTYVKALFKSQESPSIKKVEIETNLSFVSDGEPASLSPVTSPTNIVCHL